MAIAFFDLDNTLIGGDSDHLWGEYLCSVGAVDSDFYALKNDQFYQDYRDGELDIIAYNQFCLAPLAAHPVEQLHRWRNDFTHSVIKPIILPPGLKQIERHRRQGDQVIIVTATNQFVTAPISAAIGADELIATTPETLDGLYTGDLTGIPCFQDGKVIRVQEWLARSNQKLHGSYFYSDSYNDLPLLQLVDYPLAVDPDDRLRAHAIQNSWQVLSFRDASAL